MRCIEDSFTCNFCMFLFLYRIKNYLKIYKLYNFNKPVNTNKKYFMEGLL